MPFGAASRLAMRIVLPGVAVGTLGLAAFAHHQRTLAVAETQRIVDTYARLLGRTVATNLRDAMLAKDRPRIQRELASLQRLPPVRAVAIADKTGRAVFASNPRQVGEKLSALQPTCATCHLQGAAPDRGEHSLRVADAAVHLVRSVAPIAAEPACTKCHEVPAGTVVGLLVVDLDDATTASELGQFGTAAVAWGALGLLAVLAVLALAMRGAVLRRLGQLGQLLELLRTGARAAVPLADKGDAIDDLVQAVQALTLDLDQRLAVERSARRVGETMDTERLPALLCDAQGAVLAANEPAAHSLGHPRSQICGIDAAATCPKLLALQQEAALLGWALPRPDEPGPAVVALADPTGQPSAFVSVWPQPADLTPASAPASRSDSAPWQAYAAAVAGSLHSAPSRGSVVMRFDPRLAHARRLGAELVHSAQRAADDHSPVDMVSLLALAAPDLRRQHPQVDWRTLIRARQQVMGARYLLRELLLRLGRAAARQAADDGQKPSGKGTVMLFLQDDLPGRKVFAGAFVGNCALAAAIDSPLQPPLALQIARAHGGDLEVDNHFDLRCFHGFADLDWPQAHEGTLFLAILPALGQGAPAPRRMA